MLPNAEWWQDARLSDRLQSALQHFNDARRVPNDRPLDSARALLSGINLLYTAYHRQCTLLAQRVEYWNDAKKLTQLILAVPNARTFANGGALRNLASLEPAIMDQRVLEEHLDNPWLQAGDIPANIRSLAASKHNAFKAEFARYASRGSGYRAMLR